MTFAVSQPVRWGLAGLVAFVCGTTVTVPALERPAGKTYGEAVQLKTALPVATLLDQPERYVGRVVRVDGVVSAVCQPLGCWLEIAEAAGGRGIRFKLKDGVAVIPRDAAGRQAAAEGVLEATTMSAARAAQPADPRASGAVGLPPAAVPAEKVYWVRARGVVLY